ncbi:MAG: hypothetical protein MJZ87_08870 [Bacteroidales bacterium]|nr:hypothetical protein [Bacteroidales bacterium]
MNSESQNIEYKELWRENTHRVMTLFEEKFISELIDIVETARNMSFRAANLMQVASNWLLGWRIVEQEQHGEKRAAYGKHIIEIASKAMTE